MGLARTHMHGWGSRELCLHAPHLVWAPLLLHIVVLCAKGSSAVEGRVGGLGRWWLGGRDARTRRMCWCWVQI